MSSATRGEPVLAAEALGGIARTLDQTLRSSAARRERADNLRSAVLDRRGTAVQFHPRLTEAPLSDPGTAIQDVEQVEQRDIFVNPR